MIMVIRIVFLFIKMHYDCGNAMHAIQRRQGGPPAA